MQIGMVGLGRMGANMVRRLMRGGHTAVVFDPDQAAVQKLVAEGAIGAASLDEFVAKLESPKTAWCMVPHGAITEQAIRDLGERLGKGDAIIDGGNTYFKDDVRRAKELAGKGIAYLDVGTSGGVWGLERGYCLMIGAPDDQFARLEPIFKTLAPGKGTIDVTPGIDKARARAGLGPGRLPALRTGRRRALRQDGAQRHRVRPDAGLRGRLRPDAIGQQGRRPGGAAVRLQRRRRRRSVAARQRRRRRGCST